jgi:hypothetical protein
MAVSGSVHLRQTGVRARWFGHKWTEWHRDRISCEVLSFALSVSFRRRCSIHIHYSITAPSLLSGRKRPWIRHRFVCNTLYHVLQLYQMTQPTRCPSVGQRKLLFNLCYMFRHTEPSSGLLKPISSRYTYTHTHTHTHTRHLPYRRVHRVISSKLYA